MPGGIGSGHALRRSDQDARRARGALRRAQRRRARTRPIATIDGHCRAFIARSPFVLVATADADGRCDVSPRGGGAGLRLGARRHPARRSPTPAATTASTPCSNIVQTGRVGLLFLIPGHGRDPARQRARLHLARPRSCSRSTSPAGKAPRVVIGVDLDEAFLHCAKAFIRSTLWDPVHVARPRRACRGRRRSGRTTWACPSPLERDRGLARRRLRESPLLICPTSALLSPQLSSAIAP